MGTPGSHSLRLCGVGSARCNELPRSKLRGISPEEFIYFIEASFEEFDPERFNKGLESTPGFLWMVTEGNDRTAQVNAGRAYVRVQLTGTAHGISMQPHQQALQEYPEQQALYKEIHDLLGAPLPRYTVQMWARAGYGPRVEPAPRRGLEAQIVKPVSA